jgi:hypothetical protein
MLLVPVKMQVAALDIDWETEWCQKDPEAALVLGSLGEEDSG